MPKLHPQDNSIYLLHIGRYIDVVQYHFYTLIGICPSNQILVGSNAYAYIHTHTDKHRHTHTQTHTHTHTHTQTLCLLKTAL